MSGNVSRLYRKLMRLRANRSRLNRRISILERRLEGKKSRWGQCAQDRNRK